MKAKESPKWVPSSQPEAELLDVPCTSPPLSAVRIPVKRVAEVVPSSQPYEQELADSGSDREHSSPTARPHNSDNEHSPQAEVIPTSQSLQEGEITPEWMALIAARAAAFKFKYVPSHLSRTTNTSVTNTHSYRCHPPARGETPVHSPSVSEASDGPDGDYDAQDEYSSDSQWCPSPPPIPSQFPSIHSSSPELSYPRIPSPIVRDFYATFERPDSDRPEYFNHGTIHTSSPPSTPPSTRGAQDHGL